MKRNVYDELIMVTLLDETERLTFEVKGAFEAAERWVSSSIVPLQ